MDILSEILQTVKLRGTIYFHARFQSPWGMQIPSGEFANYHLVTKGECRVQLNMTQERLLLQEGDMILFTQGDSHTLVDNFDSEVKPVAEFLNITQPSDNNEIIFGGKNKHSCSLICGHFEYDKEFSHALFETLPPFIHISAKKNLQATWFSTTSKLAAQISQGNAMGKVAITNRLAESLFIQTLVIYINTINNSSSFLAAIQDKQIGMVLQSIHNQVNYNWNIAKLASIASMSKSSFSAKFNAMAGEPPIVYLARWRMLKAYNMLLETTIPIRIISQEVGYQSEYSFSKAFKKITGRAPNSVRKMAFV